MSDSRKTFWTVIKPTTFFICLAGCAGNSFMICKQFINKQTLTSEDVQNIGDLGLPSFTICGVSGFKERITKLRDLERDNFDNKTLGFDEIFLWVEDMTIDELRKNISWKITTTYSPFRGRCHTIRYIPKVTTHIKSPLNGNFIFNIQFNF